MANERRRRSDADTPPITDDRRRVPPQVPDDAIRTRAYEIFEGRGSEPGRDWDDWLQAERELRPSRADE